MPLYFSQGFQHRSTISAEHNNGVFARFRSRNNRASSLAEGSLSYRIIDLCTSTIKMDAEDTDLRLCFRIISPLKTYTLQVIYLIEYQIFYCAPGLFSLHFVYDQLIAIVVVLINGVMTMWAGDDRHLVTFYLFCIPRNLAKHINGLRIQMVLETLFGWCIYNNLQAQ